MKRAVRNVFGFSDAQLWGSQADKEGVDPRYGFSTRWLLQRLGTEGLRLEFGEDVHVRALLHGLQREEAARAPAAAPRLYVSTTCVSPATRASSPRAATSTAARS